MLNHPKLIALLTLAMGIAWGPTIAAAGPANYKVSGGENKVQFVSDAPLEKITGATSQVSGAITLDPANLAKAKGQIAVKIASLDTNNDLRDEHLRGDDWLNAKKHPKAIFKIKKVSGAKSLQQGKAVDVKVHGSFTIHGVTKPVVAKARVRLTDKNVLRVQANFKVKLTDFKVSVPQVVRLKVANDIEVNVTLRAKS